MGGKDMKISKHSFLAMFFIILMLVSTFAYTFLRSVNNPTKKITLPEQNIIDFELTADQEVYAYSQGKTVAKFYYYSGCLECSEQLSFLESLANQFSDQVILEEILTKDGTHKLTITSYYGQRNLDDATDEEILDVFCELMVRPPVMCATRKV